MRGTYNTNSQVKFQTKRLEPSLCNYSDAYVLFKGSVVLSTAAVDVNVNNKNKILAFKNYAPFTDCVSRINSEKEDNAKDVDALMAVVIVQKSQDADFSIKEINQFYVIIVILLILVLMIPLFNLNLKQK